MTFIVKNMIIIILLIGVVITGAALTFVSQRVYDTQKSVAEKSRDLVAEQWELRALKAEWAYLTRPDRIDQLSGAADILQSQIMSSQDFKAISAATNEIVPVPLLKPRPVATVEPAIQRNKDSVVRKSAGDADRDFSSLLQFIGGDE